VNISVTSAGNKPPVVNITSPANNATFTAPATVNIQAAASDSDGVIRRVVFYQGSTQLGVDSVAPYTWTWSNVAAGTYSLTARATDNGGATTTSAPVTITVSGSSSGCDGIPVWSSTAVYTGGAQVVYNGKVYTAKWWTQGEQPDISTGDGKPWKYVRDCTGAALASSQPEQLIAYPNPVTGPDLQIQVNAPAGDKLLVEVLDLKGSAPVLQQIHIANAKGTQPLRVDMSKVPNGTWIIRVTSQQSRKIWRSKVVKL
jgi:chitinase